MSSIESGSAPRVENVAATRREVSPLRFVKLATASMITLWFVVGSGAVVRLTASGLGCDNWPRCGDTPFPEKGGHAAIEFGNRMIALVGIILAVITWIAARRVRTLPQWARTVALLTALGTIAQIPLGGVTVLLDLHPVAVMSHFLLALIVLAGSVVLALEGWSVLRGLAPPVGPHWLRVVGLIGVAACAVLVVTGTVATASGPHSGWRGHPAPGPRDHGHGVRARACDSRLRDRVPRRRGLPLEAAARGARHRPRRSRPALCAARADGGG